VKYVLGYELRCANPGAYDVEYTRILGEAAVRFLIEGGTNAIITLQSHQVVPIPYEQMIDPGTGRTEVRMVNTHAYRYLSAYKFMTRLKPEAAEDEELLKRLAELTKMDVEAFKSRYGYLIGISQRPF
jgi:6-phosphofructokinase 1